MTSLAARNTNTRFKSIQRIVGILLVLSSLTMVPPAVVSWWYDDTAFYGFVASFALISDFDQLKQPGTYMPMPDAHCLTRGLQMRTKLSTNKQISGGLCAS